MCSDIWFLLFRQECILFNIFHEINLNEYFYLRVLRLHEMFTMNLRRREFSLFIFMMTLFSDQNSGYVGRGNQEDTGQRVHSFRNAK